MRKLSYNGLCYPDYTNHRYICSKETKTKTKKQTKQQTKQNKQTNKQKTIHKI